MTGCVLSELVHRVAKFFGVADLNDSERRTFLDEWLTRAEKIYDDDLLLNKCRKPNKRSTAETRNLYQPSGASRDATDGQCVSLIGCF